YSLGSGYSENRKEFLGEPTVSTYLFESVSGDLVPYVETNFDNVTQQTMSVQDQFSNNLNQSVFFSLSIPVFNNFGTKAGIERAKVDLLSAKL
ncbi:MAG TPA: TolC family protein, partial [Flavobacteriales bacterium]|nr:TolC family protein [Flavobacteriales bacterium]